MYLVQPRDETIFPLFCRCRHIFTRWYKILQPHVIALHHVHCTEDALKLIPLVQIPYLCSCLKKCIFFRSQVAVYGIHSTVKISYTWLDVVVKFLAICISWFCSVKKRGVCENLIISLAYYLLKLFSKFILWDISILVIIYNFCIRIFLENFVRQVEHYARWNLSQYRITIEKLKTWLLRVYETENINAYCIKSRIFNSY